MINMQCPHCFEDKPLGATHCPKCTHKVTADETGLNEFFGLLWMIVIGTIIWNLIT